jgi:hypothetical protein
MRNTLVIIILTVLIVALTAVSTFGSWLIFSKPEFRGRMIDAETKQPIEGVVVVAIYQTAPILTGPAGGSSSVIHVKEALTDKNGEFRIPRYTTLIQPNSGEADMDFIIYKPGYASYTLLYHDRIYPLKYRGPELLFSKELGTKDEIRRGSEVITITNGVAELPKLETKEERLRAAPSTNPGELSPEDIPLLYQAINEERKRFRLGPIGRVRE